MSETDHPQSSTLPPSPEMNEMGTNKPDSFSEKDLTQHFAKQQPKLSNDVFKLLKEFQKLDVKSEKARRFWSTQPVVQPGDAVSEDMNGPLLAPTPHKDIRKEPYNLVDGFVWFDLELTNQQHLDELYVLLNENYVEDDENMFRFDYSREFLRWSLTPPNYRPEWHAGVRVDKTRKLVAFISAIPATVRVRDKSISTVEINFLCVHKRLRSKRLAPVLIKEITRRVNLHGIFQAAYTSGTNLPGIIGRSSYWHRSLNVKKLIDVKFSFLARNMTLNRLTKLLRLPDTVQTPGFRELTIDDVAEAHALLTQYLENCDISQIFTIGEFKHTFLPQPGVIESFVVQNVDTGKLTDFCSFYLLPSTVVQHINNPAYRKLTAAYSYYNVATVTPWINLMKDCLISAKNKGCDVFNALDLMDNHVFLRELKFGIGDGTLQYYLYNWKTQPISNNKIGLVLL